jgi:inosine/xanthosine triphosphate pyrophosphatase family protein
MKVFLATNNSGKVERFKKLLKQAVKEIEVFTPESLNIAVIDVEDTGSTLADNAKLKANAYFAKLICQFWRTILVSM